MQRRGCKRAILVGHNAWFDLSFLNAAVARAGLKRCPFHPFSSFDTATLAGAALGQTVLAKAATIAGLGWDSGSAHSASYDAERTAELFCTICNELGGSFSGPRVVPVSLAGMTATAAGRNRAGPRRPET